MIARLQPSVKWLSAAANLAIVVLSVVIAPYILTTGTFWGAPIGELIAQIVVMCVLPIAAIPLSLLRADRFLRQGKPRDATRMRFIPLLIFLVIGPLGFLLTDLIARNVQW